MIRRNEYAAQTMRGEDCQVEEDGRVEGWKNHGRKKNTKNNETEKWRRRLNYEKEGLSRRQQSRKMERPRKEEERPGKWNREMKTKAKLWEGRNVKKRTADRRSEKPRQEEERQGQCSEEMAAAR